MLISREFISSRDSRIEAASYLTVICLPTVWQLVCIRFIIPESRVPEWRYNVKQLISEWPVSPCGKGATDKLDCKTAVFFANASDGPYSNEGSWASEKTARENGERLTLEDHAYGASRLPKTTVLQSTDKYSINRHSLSNFLQTNRASFAVWSSRTQTESAEITKTRGLQELFWTYANSRDRQSTQTRAEKPLANASDVTCTCTVLMVSW